MVVVCDEVGPTVGVAVASARSEPAPDVVEEVLTATRALIALSTRSLGALAEDLSAAQYRTLVVLASRGPRPLVDLAQSLGVNPSTAGRMCDRLARKGFVRRHRDRQDRRIVVVSLSGQGRRVLDEATAARRAVIAQALSALSVEQQRAAGAALRELSCAVGEVPDRAWPRASP
jgi:DNA-binding MarR family transcriptional regulator